MVREGEQRWSGRGGIEGMGEGAEGGRRLGGGTAFRFLEAWILTTYPQETLHFEGLL